MAKRHYLQKYRVLRRGKTTLTLDLDVHAFVVAHATRNEITVRRAGRELILAGAAYLSAREDAEKANPLKILLPTETTD